MTTAIADPTTAFTLTEDQQNAFDAFAQFLLDPSDPVFVLQGYSGCGKTTLVRTLLDQIPDIYRTAKLINPSFKPYEIELTATTNKAAENLTQITGSSARTIHALLGLRPQTDQTTGEVILFPNRVKHNLEHLLLFVDEASYVDSQLLEYIFKLTKNCKVVFIGDPAQLTPVKATNAPVFEAKFRGAALTQVVRQAEGNPIVQLSTLFRHAVNTGQFFSGFKLDGHHLQHMDRASFLQAIEAEFIRPDWRYADSKILAWTNKCVIDFNKYVRARSKGDPELQAGDYAVCNAYTTVNKKSFRTDQMVQVTEVLGGWIRYGVAGKEFLIDNSVKVFMPDSLTEKRDRLNRARKEGDWNIAHEISESWIDLRAAYACTINKAQGSTFDRVFIDLDDIRRCHISNQIARMLYVAVSRARHQVFLTGDLA